MSVVFDHRNPGTAEQEWDAAGPWRHGTPLSLDVEQLVVLAAHPDDETLGTGGLIAIAAAVGIPVTVVIATDGEGSHPQVDVGSTRRQESVAALAELAPGAALTFLGYPDGGVREHADAIRGKVSAILAGSLARTTLLAAPWWGDGHRDHRVLGEVALSLRSGRLQVVGYPIWFWHWGDPNEQDARTWCTVELSAAVRTAKRAAVACHDTQISPSGQEPPVLHAGMLAHFDRGFEVFVAASAGSSRDSATPAGNAKDSATPAGQPNSSATPAGFEAFVAHPTESATPAYFEDFHRRHDDPWGLEGRWYEKRKRDVLLACLPQESAGRVLEIGCASAVVTAELRERAGHVLAVDVSETALARASARVGADPRVELRRAHLPAEWPDGEFDLVVLSEVGYFWSRADLDDAVERIIAALPDRGVFVACHWRHAFAEAPLTGDDVHALIRARPQLEQIVRHVEPDFLLDVFVRHRGES